MNGLPIPTFLSLALVLGSASAAAPLPAYFSVPKGMVISHPERMVVEDDAVASFRLPGDSPSLERRGKRYFVALTMQPDLEQEPAEVWAAAKPALVSDGWQVIGEVAGPPIVATLHRKAHGKDVWAAFTARASNESTVEIIESR